MQKVYRLLRNNQETGPYTLDEILQLNLKPFDLVWVDGRSAAWRYPAEIETLKAYVPEAAQPSTPFEPVATAVMEQNTFIPPDNSKKEPSKNIFVSMPGKNQQVTVEQKETRPQPQPQTQPPPQPVFQQNDHQRFCNPGPTPSTQVPEPEVFQTNYSRSLNDVEEDYTSWVYRQKTTKKKSVSKKDLAVAAVIILLIAGGYFIISKPSVIEPLSVQKSTPVLPQPQENNTVTQNEAVDNDAASSLPAVKSTEKKKTVDNSRIVTTDRNGNNINRQNNKALPIEDETVAANDEIKEAETKVPQKENTTVATKKEKKKLGEVIRGIFTKKDKKETPKEETVMEEPKPATNRQATKRNEASEGESETNNAALAEMVDVTSNAPENWMMGVTGLKLTLRNRNNVALQTAAVQVLYYDENNVLLDRKSVYFNNVPAKGKMTMAAPDHKFADHVDFKVLAVTAKADQYASNHLGH